MQVVELYSDTTLAASRPPQQRKEVVVEVPSAPLITKPAPSRSSECTHKHVAALAVGVVILTIVLMAALMSSSDWNDLGVLLGYACLAAATVAGTCLWINVCDAATLSDEDTRPDVCVAMGSCVAGVGAVFLLGWSLSTAWQ